jgi:hypothetical protein
VLIGLNLAINRPGLRPTYNLLTNTEAFDKNSWTAARCTVSANATAAPNGTATADALVEDSTASSTHVLVQAFTPAAAIYTTSVYAKANNRSWLFLFTNDGTTQRSAYFQLSGSGVVGTTSNANAGIVLVGSGWYRCWMTSTAAYAAATTNLQLGAATGDGGSAYSGTGVSSLYLWGAQAERADTLGPYVPG